MCVCVCVCVYTKLIYTHTHTHTHEYIYIYYIIYIYIYIGDCSRGKREGSHFLWLLHRSVGEGATPFPGLHRFTLNPYLIILYVKQRGTKYYIF